jgi:hypothetical protein
MENMNLLDLDDDILNIIGDYVKKDNHDRLKKREEVIRNSIKLFEILKKSKWNDNKPAMRHVIINYFYVNNIRDIETIDLFLTLVKLNLKRKKYTFSTYCVEKLEDSIKIYDKILEKNTLDFYIYYRVYCEHYIIRFFH